MTITLRTEKGFPLTYEELDANFSDLDTRLNTIEGIAVNNVNGQTGNVVLTTSNIAEGTNTYYTNARFDARLAAKSTTDIAEGSNLYFTAARVRANINVGAGLAYNSTTGTVVLSANTDIITEGISNQYYTDAKADARIAAATLDDINDVDYPSAPNNGEVLTWNSLSGKWEPILPPGAAGGETNTASNIGGAVGLFAGKVGADLKFYTLQAGSGVTLSGPTANVITFNTQQDISVSGTPTFTRMTLLDQANIANVNVSSDGITNRISGRNLNLAGNTTGYVVIDSGSGLAVNSGSLFVSNISTFSNANINLTPNGSGQVIASDLAVSTLTSGRLTLAGANGTLTDSSLLTFAGNTLSVTGTVAANILTAANNITSTSMQSGNITISGDTVSTVEPNANINITSTGTGKVRINSAMINDLSNSRVVFAGVNGQLVDSANFTFNGSTMVVVGTANINTVNAGNITTSSNQISTLNSNGNINLAPNGSGRVGINTTTPAYLLTVNGSMGATTINTTGSTVVGNSLTVGTSTNTDTINFIARMASSILPNSSGTYDLGSNTLKFRNAWLNGQLSVDGSVVMGDSTSDTVTFNALVGSTIIPSANNTYDLGTNLARWKDVYASGTLFAESANVNTLNANTINANVLGILTTTVTGTNSASLIAANMADNDQFRILVGGTASDAGFAEIATANEGSEQIYVRQYTGNFASVARTLTLLDDSGNTIIPGTLAPTSNVTNNIGSTSLRWNNVYAANVVGTLTNTVTGTNTVELVRGNMADSDQFRILVGGTASDAGFAEIATADNGTEPIYVRQYTGAFSTVARTLTLLDDSGNTSFPGAVIPIANLTQDLGTTALRWNTVFGRSTSAQYADLAERYEADDAYDEGTVLVFGGDKEVTACTFHADTAAAGVVSTKPAYVMNDDGQDPSMNPAVALRGKVPVKVIGKVSKGDLLVTSDVAGHAVSVGKEDYGASVIAKSLENKDDQGPGMIQAVVI